MWRCVVGSADGVSECGTGKWEVTAGLNARRVTDGTKAHFETSHFIEVVTCQARQPGSTGKVSWELLLNDSSHTVTKCLVLLMSLWSRSNKSFFGAHSQKYRYLKGLLEKYNRTRGLQTGPQAYRRLLLL